MSFDWIAFFDRHHIDYRTSGANVGGDNVAIKCPFCGVRDHSQHMSVSTTGMGWHCWRDTDHAGRTPTRLIQALLNCTWSEASDYAGIHRHLPDTSTSLVDTITGILTQSGTLERPPVVELPSTCRPLSCNLPVANPYRDYVRRRGFDPDQLDVYDLFFDHRGRFHGRIVFAIKAASGNVVGLTGRAIGPRMEPRYLFEGSTDATLLWSYMFPERANVLVLCEGPFDALKVNTLGNERGIYATCCLTSSYSRTQRSMLYQLLPRFGHTLALFDHGNEVAGFRLSNLFPGRITPCRLPTSVKDPAELNDLEFLTH